MAKTPATFDVWFLVADTVYTGVPYQVVADWAGQGRLKGTDKLRASGGNNPWVLVQDHPLIADFLYKTSATAASATATTAPTATQPGAPQEALEPLEMEVAWTKSHGDDDDDPDMIPLIDISLVLLIFFMMTASVAAMSPVNVPALKHAGEFSKDMEAITISIQSAKAGDANQDPVYSVRLGDKAPDKSDDNLRDVSSVIQRLTAKLSGLTRAPEVRIACEKTLPRKHVKALTMELDKLRKKTPPLISSYGAEVNEKK